MQETPDEIVTKRIIAELRERKLLPEKRMSDLEPMLRTGGISSIAWEQMVELTIMEEEKARNVQKA